jgi:type IV secretory pathway VirB10-like protein
MADDLGRHIEAGDPDEPQRPGDGASGAVPPPLSAIRVKGPRPKGLNKPAIIAAVGGGTAIVLVLASGSFSNDPSRKPAEARPMMSDPARPEMAKGAVRELPATYAEAQSFIAATQPAAPPQLGPPLPGDIAAFAPNAHQHSDYTPPTGQDWSEPPSYGSTGDEDPLAQEAALADRSGIFFSLREEPQKVPSAAAPQITQQRPQSPLTALGRASDDQQSAGPAHDRTLHPGAVISASLVTGINSESPGPVIAQVTQSIHDSATGRILLIPQGARLIGDYRSGAKYGQSRLAILWSRLIMPDGREIILDEAAVDPSGAAGVSGQVDNHWGDVFGAAALGTLINIGVATTEDPQLTYGGIGVMGRDTVDAAIADGVQRSANIVTNRVVDRSLAIPPTIRIEAGKRISIIVTRHMGF